MKSTLFTIFSCFFSLILFSQTFSSEYINYHRTGLDDDCGATVTDVNNDGTPDVVFGFEARKELMSLTKNQFNLHKINVLFDTINGCSFLKAFDYDQDGDDDILANLRVDGYWRLYLLRKENDTYTSVTYLRQSYELTFTVEMLDVDMDGDMDFLVDPSGNNNTLELYSQDTPNSFSSTVLSFIGQPASLHAIADFNYDTYVDALVSYYNFTVNDYIYGIYQNTNGVFNFIPLDTTDLYLYASVGDFNHDGKIDFATKNIGQNLQLHINNSITDFTTAEYAIGNNKRLIPSIDYDGDGYLDICIHNMSIGTISIFELIGTDLGETQLNGLFGRIPIAYIDMNDDGRKDFVCSENGSIYILNNSNENEFALDYTNNYNSFNNLPAIYDRNGNGKLDVCLGRYNLLSFKDQHFSEYFYNIKEDFIEGTTYDINSNLRQIFPYDKDGDGKEELLVNMNNTLFWVVYDENNVRSFESVSESFSATIYWVGDLDFDGKVDILSAGNTNYQRIERNTATSYTQSTINSSMIYPFEIGDIDNDNDLDYISYEWDISLQKHFLVVGRNQGNENYTHERQFELSTFFSPSSQLTTVNNAIKLVSADTDNDGDLDAFIQSPVADKVLFLENDGTGIFSGSLLTNTFDSPQSINTIDMNNDGFVDLVLSNRDDGQITILTNNQDNTFNQTFLPNNVAYPEFVKVLDFDADGDLDIITSSVGDHKVVLLKNQELNCERTYSYNETSICSNDSILFNNNYIKETGLYYDTLVGVNTCDSVHVLELKHNLISTNNLNQSICSGDSLLFNGNYVLNEGQYYDTLQNVLGCDSIVSLNLSYTTTPNLTISQNDTNLVSSLQGNTYNWYLNDVLLSDETGSQAINYHTYGNGEYYLELVTSNPCNIFSNTITIANAHLNETNLMFSLYPNPAQDFILLETEKIKASKVEILSLNGVLCFEKELKESSNKLDLSALKKGMYLVKVHSHKEVFTTSFVKF